MAAYKSGRLYVSPEVQQEWGGMSDREKTAFYLLLATFASIFITEVIINFIFSLLPPMSPLIKTFNSAAALVILIAPMLYFLFLRPLIKHIVERKKVENLLKESERKLLQSQKMETIGSLTGGVAHDFGNILTIIECYVVVRQKLLPEGDSGHEDFAEIRKALQRAGHLVKQLLAFSRRQSGEQSVIDLNSIVINLNKMLQRLIGDGIELTVVPGKEIGNIKADPNQIDQVLLNLVINARDAMSNGGKITIQTSRETFSETQKIFSTHELPAGDYALLTVSDTGDGIKKEDQERIFEPFFTTKEEGKGTGLGLSTISGIVKQSNGFIWVSSELNQGTTFRIYLPQAEKTVKTLEKDEKLVESPAGETETVRI